MSAEASSATHNSGCVYLHHLVCALAHDVQADHLELRAQANELHDSLGLLVDLHLVRRVAQVGEASAVHLEVLLAVLGLRLRLREAHSRQRRVRKHDRWDLRIVQLGASNAMEQAVSEQPTWEGRGRGRAPQG